ncbi:MAG: hypothetical protein PVF43_02495, partial [Candidatus Eiseniibacteriota bacterium]
MTVPRFHCLAILPLLTTFLLITGSLGLGGCFETLAPPGTDTVDDDTPATGDPSDPGTDPSDPGTDPSDPGNDPGNEDPPEDPPTPPPPGT